MKSLPFTTKILLVLLIIVAGRFVWRIIDNSSSVQAAKTPSKQKITTVDEILTCEQYKQQIISCTSEAMVCLEQISKSKQFHQQNEHKIIQCQKNNERNLQLNQELRVKLDAVTERLDELLNKRLPPNAQKSARNTEL